ncbi:MAG: LysR substrate-binding domain-containing protein [Verrucomicrobiae bacterium]|nr:LysR substrate-binding domain-containing protein [Verrucomicrobiae bacterium]
MTLTEVFLDLLMSQHSIRPQVSAEVSDMAMLRLLAREIDAITLVPRVVIRDELKNKTLVELHCIDQIRESFYAITPSRHFPNSLVKEIVQPLIHKKSSSKKRTTTSRR